MLRAAANGTPLPQASAISCRTLGVPRACSSPIAELRCTRALRAVRAAEELRAGLEPVSEDADAAVAATGSQLLDRAFERVEPMDRSVHVQLEGLVVFVSAGVTPSSHQTLTSAFEVSHRRARCKPCDRTVSQSIFSEPSGVNTLGLTLR